MIAGRNPKDRRLTLCEIALSLSGPPVSLAALEREAVSQRVQAPLLAYYKWPTLSIGAGHLV